MPSIARKNLLLDIPRFLVAQAGIMFAVSLVTIQTGLQYGFARSASILIEKSQADIWVSAENQVHIGLTLPIPYDSVEKAKKVIGVERSEALIVNGSVWRDRNNNLNSVTFIGFAPEGKLFAPWNITQGNINSLKNPYTILVDNTSLEGLSIKGIGDTGIIGNLPAHIVGLTADTKSLIFGDITFTSLETAHAYETSPPNSKLPCLLANQNIHCSISQDNFAETPKKLSSQDSITFVLVKAQAGQDLQLLKKRLEAALPNTRAYTRQEMALKTQQYWMERSGIGFVLGLGAVVGVIVGVVIVGQILYSSVSDHIREFGTLKAMGASDLSLYGIILEQSLWMAILGYIPGMALCFGVAYWTAATQGILILITPASAVIVFGITVIMCTSSAIFAIQKVTRVDPAIVFKA